MARTLIDPIPPPVAPDIIQQGITHISISISHMLDTDTGLRVIDKSAVTLDYQIADYNELGEVVAMNGKNVMFDEWPTVVKTAVKDLYVLVETHAENSGLLQPGDDEPLE